MSEPIEAVMEQLVLAAGVVYILIAVVSLFYKIITSTSKWLIGVNLKINPYWRNRKHTMFTKSFQESVSDIDREKARHFAERAEKIANNSMVVLYRYNRP